MEIKIVKINEDIKSWCDICKRSSFKGIESSVSKARLIFNLTKEEKEIAKERLPFFRSQIIICQKCCPFLADQQCLWEVVLKMAVLPDIDPQKEFELEINELSNP